MDRGILRLRLRCIGWSWSDICVQPNRRTVEIMDPFHLHRPNPILYGRGVNQYRARFRHIMSSTATYLEAQVKLQRQSASVCRLLCWRLVSFHAATQHFWLQYSNKTDIVCALRVFCAWLTSQRWTWPMRHVCYDAQFPPSFLCANF